MLSPPKALPLPCDMDLPGAVICTLFWKNVVTALRPLNSYNVTHMAENLNLKPAQANSLRKYSTQKKGL
jgi:hypothetical protein